MIDLLISTYCRIDGFYIMYEKTVKDKLIGNDHPRQYGKTQSLSVSEIMTIMVMFQSVKYRNFKYYYNEFILTYWRSYFPAAPSYSRFVELMPQALVLLTAFVTSCQGKKTGIYFVDATKLPVCHNLRCAGKSKTSTGWFFGLKLHVVVNHLCEIVSFKITRGNVDDRTPLPDLCKTLKGYLFGDRGYVSKAKTATLEKQGLKLITTLKKNMKKVIRTKEEKQLLRNREIIETMFDYLKNSLMLWHTRHRSPINALTHLMTCLACWIIDPISIIGQKRLA